MVSPSDELNARASVSSSASSVSRNGATSRVKPRPGPCITSTSPYSVIACSSLPSAGASRMRKSSISAVPDQRPVRLRIVVLRLHRQPAALHAAHIIQAAQQFAGVVGAGGETAPATIGNDLRQERGLRPGAALEAQLLDHAAVVLGMQPPRRSTSRPCAISTRSNLASSVQGGPGGGSALLRLAGCGGVVRRRDAAPDRASRRSRFATIGPAWSAGSACPARPSAPAPAGPCGTATAVPPLKSARPRSDHALAVELDRVDAGQPVMVQQHARRRLRRRIARLAPFERRHGTVPPPVRSAVTARSPWPLRRSVSTACSCAGPLITDVASSPAAASCRASGCAGHRHALHHLRRRTGAKVHRRIQLRRDRRQQRAPAQLHARRDWRVRSNTP